MLKMNKQACADAASLNANKPRTARRRITAALILAPMVLALAACGGTSGSTSGGSATPKAPAATAASESNPAYVKAQELFTTNKCISCHGVDLSGKAGAKTNLQKVGSKLSSEQIANQIKNGGGGMPVYKTKLSDEEIGLLTDWLSSKK
ncbi:cytochrome c [Paenibacillus sp. HWE-109]|uniref:c-type cytochrome n=1 Tax=Paenibacillus sp. HWE-109 TaxID=1306526 RepID=UPI001EE11F76|nr:cytochrome c [Paenibacillus sp. HWE-109]UKS26476.1 cytochrome c [Paenibacillus sp. HWE-109]